MTPISHVTFGGRVMGLYVRLCGQCELVIRGCTARVTYVWANWVLSTNHRRLAALYFALVFVAGTCGLALATIIRIELAYPGPVLLNNNAERYLTIISLHGVIMVFFVVIPALFGAFGNFLLPTQLGVRDVAFPRLNSFMF
jgi:heme/copper-type cytochrome/quinol oxidase subunit 1